MRVRILLVGLLLVSSALSVAATAPDDSIELVATDNSYVVADVSNQDDPQGLRDKNFSGLDFLKIWYANQVQATEQIVSVGLVKFDLSGLKDREVRSASLQLFAQRADLLQPVRLVDVSLAEGQWAQGAVTFNTLPQITNPPLASTAIYGANIWYTWDVTSAVVRKQADGSVSYALGLRTLEQKGEEQVIFSSTGAGRNPPRMLLTMAPASPAVSLYALPIAIIVAALLAFGGGLLIGRRRSARRRTAAVSAIRGPMVRSATDVADTDDVDAVMECPACHRQIPAVAEVCPRCGATVSAGEPLPR